jgi:hypothetical protein
MPAWGARFAPSTRRIRWPEHRLTRHTSDDARSDDQVTHIGTTQSSRRRRSRARRGVAAVMATPTTWLVQVSVERVVGVGSVRACWPQPTVTRTASPRRNSAYLVSAP